MGAEEREQVALFSSSGAEGAETREQLSRESSAVRGSEEGKEANQRRQVTLRSVYNPSSSTPKTSHVRTY